MTTIGQRIRELRQQLQWSKSELARRCGKTRQSVGDWETGRHTPEGENLVALADALGTTPGELLGYSTSVDRPSPPSIPSADAPPRWALQLMSQLERVATTLDRVEQKIERLSLGDDERPDTATPAPVTVAPRVARPYRAASDTSERLTGADLERFLDEQELAERAEEHDPKTEGAEPAV